MQRRAPVVVAVVSCLVAFTVPVAAQNPPPAVQAATPTAESLLDKLVEATGGKATLAKINSRVIKATVEILGVGLTIDSVTVAARPNKVHSIATVPGMGTIESGSDGTVAWEISPMTGARLKEGTELADALFDARFDSSASWRDLYSKVERAGTATIDGKVCDKVVMTRKDGRSRTVYLDPQSHLVAKLEQDIVRPEGTFTIEAFPSDYRAVDGVMVPFRSRVLLAGQERVTTVSSYQHNVTIPDAEFTFPKEIQALIAAKK